MNEHIADYCKEYIENKNSPQFAVFLKGEWGCGKTHFINNIIEKYPDGKSQNTTVHRKDIMYLSLFGVDQTSEIDDLIFQKLHPVLSSKQFRFSTNILLAILRSKLDFDLDKKEPPIDLYNLETKKVIIVDDLERSGLSPSQIFGYFSEHLYQHGIKIIFIGNEDIITKDDNKSKEDYLKIKEKTIGIEFLIEPEIETAIDAFIEELSLADEKFSSFKNLCLDASRILECNNLRTIRQCLYNLKILLDSLGTDAVSNHINEIAKTFINLFIQKSLNFINDKNQIQEAIHGYERYKVNYKKYGKLKEENINARIINYSSKYIPLYNCWGGIIFDGNYSKEKLTEEYNKENAVNASAQPKKLFLLLSIWREINKESFKQIINDINKEFQDGSYLHPGEILHYLNIMLIFSHWGLIAENEENVKETVDKILSIYEDKIIPVDDWGLLGIAYGGWGYSNDIPELEELRSRLKDISYKNRCTQIKNTINDEIQKIRTDVKEFCSNLTHINGTNKYYKMPILSLIDIKSFFDILVNLDVGYQSNIISAFEERYEKIYSNGVVCKEYQLDSNNVKKLSELYDASLGEILYDPKEYFKRDISKRLHNLLDFFDK
jgi:hypothetical protein